MTSDFTHLYINDTLPADLDQIAVSRLEAAFPTPYITPAEAAEDTYHYTQAQIDAARERNIEVARQARKAIIENVGLLDMIGAMTILGTRAAVDAAHENRELIVVEDHGVWLYPAFQFNTETLKPYPVIKDINTRLFEKEISHWNELLWWVTKNSHLNDENPVAFLTPQRADKLAAYIRDMPAV